MDTIARILAEKGSQVCALEPSATVVAAVERMCAERIGALLVCEGGEPVGVFSERDLMTRVILAQRDPRQTTLAQVMTRDVVCVDPDTSFSEAMAIMSERRCRHLPVVRESRLVGIISIGDLVRWASRDQQFHIRMLTNYIHGKYPT